MSWRFRVFIYLLAAMITISVGFHVLDSYWQWPNPTLGLVGAIVLFALGVFNLVGVVVNLPPFEEEEVEEKK